MCDYFLNPFYHQGIGVYFPKAEICQNIEEFLTMVLPWGNIDHLQGRWYNDLDRASDQIEESIRIILNTMPWAQECQVHLRYLVFIK
jgi:hypothetical protein